VGTCDFACFAAVDRACRSSSRNESAVPGCFSPIRRSSIGTVAQLKWAWTREFRSRPPDSKSSWRTRKNFDLWTNNDDLYCIALGGHVKLSEDFKNAYDFPDQNWRHDIFCGALRGGHLCLIEHWQRKNGWLLEAIKMDILASEFDSIGEYKIYQDEPLAKDLRIIIDAGKGGHLDSCRYAIAFLINCFGDTPEKGFSVFHWEDFQDRSLQSLWGDELDPHYKSSLRMIGPSKYGYHHMFVALVLYGRTEMTNLLWALDLLGFGGEEQTFPRSAMEYIAPLLGIVFYGDDDYTRLDTTDRLSLAGVTLICALFLKKWDVAAAIVDYRLSVCRKRYSERFGDAVSQAIDYLHWYLSSCNIKRRADCETALDWLYDKFPDIVRDFDWEDVFEALINEEGHGDDCLRQMICWLRYKRPDFAAALAGKIVAIYGPDFPSIRVAMTTIDNIYNK
jgi:hypothetical protein